MVSVHAAGTPVAEVRRFAEAEKIAYPVCVEPGSGRRGIGGGPLFKDLYVVQLPQAYAIGRDGGVAAVGEVGRTPRGGDATGHPTRPVSSRPNA